MQELFPSPCGSPALRLLERQLRVHGNWKGSYNLSSYFNLWEVTVLIGNALTFKLFDKVQISQNNSGPLNPVLRQTSSVFPKLNSGHHFSNKKHLSKMSLQMPFVVLSSYNWLLKDEIQEWPEPCDVVEDSSHTCHLI